jgi:ribosomal 30S subunit maturation factor RimM
MAYATDHPEWLASRKSYLLADPYSCECFPVLLEQIVPRAEHGLVKLDVFDAPEQVKPYHSWELLYFARRGELPREADEVYFFELPGLQVRNAAGDVLGAVDEVLDSGAHILLGLNTLSNRYIPFTLQFVPEVNLEQGYLVTTYPLDEYVEEA